jgi:hypothetical protein
MPMTSWMRTPPEYLTRAELLGGILATSALAACGGSLNTFPPADPSCAATLAMLPDVNQIFSDPAFNTLDKATLAALFGRSDKLKGNDAGYFEQSAQHMQFSHVITNIPSSGIVIRMPGTYTFAGDLTWTPAATLSSAITIASNDVTLNLGGYTLTASVPDISWQTTGILVGTSANTLLENVKINSGTIANTTEFGIYADGVCGLDISHVTVTGVNIQNLNIRFLTPAGIFVSESLNVAITYCSVTNMTVKADSSAGIFLLTTIGASVSNCQTRLLENLDGALIGFSSIKSINVNTSDCTAQNLKTQFGGNIKGSGHTLLGFCPILCLSLNYSDCSASNLTGSCDDVHGISVFLDGLVSVERFTADTIVDGPPPYNTGAKATGIEVYGVGITVKDSSASNIIANNPQDLQATGFSAWGLSIGFNNCTATNVVVNGKGNGTGFGWAPDPRPLFKLPAIGVAYTNCTANRCAVGFDTFYHQNSVWTSPTTTNCATPILVNPTEQRTLTCDGCSECPPGGERNPPNFSAGPPPHYYETLTNIESGNIFL